MKGLWMFFIVLLGSTEVHTQIDKPIWDIGTKWTYEFKPEYSVTSFVINEIVDTVRIDGLKLYVVDSYPEYTGIRYFYYEDDKVYNYNEVTKLMQLLYDFSNEESYNVNYKPPCDPSFDETVAPYKTYTILVDSIIDFELPDGTEGLVQYVSSIDTVIDIYDSLLIVESEIKIISGVGFAKGYLHYTHDWEFGLYNCDELGNFTTNLRCFENDSVSYNFVNYPCDTTWMLSNTKHLELTPRLSVYPNPTTDVVNISNATKDCYFEIYNLEGMLLDSGQVQSSRIYLNHKGVNIIRLRQEERWSYFRVVNLD